MHCKSMSEPWCSSSSHSLNSAVNLELATSGQPFNSYVTDFFFTNLTGAPASVSPRAKRKYQPDGEGEICTILYFWRGGTRFVIIFRKVFQPTYDLAKIGLRDFFSLGSTAFFLFSFEVFIDRAMCELASLRCSFSFPFSLQGLPSSAGLAV